MHQSHQIVEIQKVKVEREYKRRKNSLVLAYLHIRSQHTMWAALITENDKLTLAKQPFSHPCLQSRLSSLYQKSSPQELCFMVKITAGTTFALYKRAKFCSSLHIYKQMYEGKSFSKSEELRLLVRWPQSSKLHEATLAAD